jgi:hypothetical protein
MESEVEGAVEDDDRRAEDQHSEREQGDNNNGATAGERAHSDSERDAGSKKSWKDTVLGVKPDVETEAAVLEVRKLRDELRALKTLVVKSGNGGKGEKSSNGGKGEKGRK